MHEPAGKPFQARRSRLGRGMRDLWGPPGVSEDGRPPRFRFQSGRPRALAVAVASGKGGTGKTVVSVNLSLELARQGKQVLYLDADLGLANGHLLLGIEPHQDIRVLLDPDPMVTSPVAGGPWGLRAIPGG